MNRKGAPRLRKPQWGSRGAHPLAPKNYRNTRFSSTCCPRAASPALARTRIRRTGSHRQPTVSHEVTVLKWPNGILFFLGLMVLLFLLNLFGIRLMSGDNRWVTWWKIIIPSITAIFMFTILSTSNFTALSFGGNSGFASYGTGGHLRRPVHQRGRLRLPRFPAGAGLRGRGREPAAARAADHDRLGGHCHGDLRRPTDRLRRRGELGHVGLHAGDWVGLSASPWAGSPLVSALQVAGVACSARTRGCCWWTPVSRRPGPAGISPGHLGPDQLRPVGQRQPAQGVPAAEPVGHPVGFAAGRGAGHRLRVRHPRAVLVHAGRVHHRDHRADLRHAGSGYR